MESILEKLDPYNHYHFRISEHTNRILCVTMTVLLIMYSLIGVLMFTFMESRNAVPFILTNLVWLVIAVIVLLKYTHRPYVVIGLYMLVVASDRILTWTLDIGEEDVDWSFYLEIILSIWMAFSGLKIIFGKLFSRYPTIITTIIFIIMDAEYESLLIADAEEFITSDVWSMYFSAFVRFLFYIFLILILACNDNPGIQGHIIQTEEDES